MEGEMSDINEQILEIRYKPNPKVLDYRGSWAEAISDHMKLPEWRILENRIDIFNESNRDRVFVGFKNAGFVTHNAPTKNYFSDKAVKVFRFLFTLTGFDKTPFIERIGVRSKFCKEYEGTFDELREKYVSNYLCLTDKAKKIMDAKLMDIGGQLNFADRYGNFNTMSGPMISAQMAQYFEATEEFSKVGLFFDIDYWLKPEKTMDSQEILKTIEQFANSGWDKYESATKVIWGE